MTATSKDEGVHRLLDIVVEEVSLVDRAANMRRFLIVKRSDPMNEDPAEQAQPGNAGAAQPEPPAQSSDAASAAAAKADDSGVDGSVLEAAVAALERLTETVETLGALADGDARARIGDTAAELRALADRLAGAVGAEVTAPDGEGGDLGTVIESVRATLQDVGTLLDQSKRAARAGEAKDEGAVEKRAPATPQPASPASAAAEEPLRKELAALNGSVGKLVDALKAQGLRLSQLEKRFGLPNSAPAREQDKRPDDEEVGWPMDLNRPFDRESVDKATSFHDL